MVIITIVKTNEDFVGVKIYYLNLPLVVIFPSPLSYIFIITRAVLITAE